MLKRQVFVNGKAAFNTGVDTVQGFTNLGLAASGPIGIARLATGNGYDFSGIKFQNVDPTLQFASDVASYVSGGVGLAKGAVKLSQLGIKQLAKSKAGSVVDGGPISQINPNFSVKGLLPNKNDVITLSPNSIRFSQSSISARTKDGQLLGDLIQSMKTIGFRSDKAIIVVRQQDGILTSLDNRRLFSASQADVDVKAIIRNRSDLLSPRESTRFARIGRPIPKTFGDAIDLRIINQSPRAFGRTNPHGSFQQPFVSLGKNNN